MANNPSTLTKTERNLWNAIVAEAMAQLKYTAFAHKALSEGHPEVAQVFQEVAGAENIHGVNHLQVAGDVKSSLENLRTVIQGEAAEVATKYPRMVRDALDDGRMDAAETFSMAMDREQHHLDVFTKALSGLDAKLAKAGPAPAAGVFAPADETAAPRLQKVAEPEVSPTFTAARKEVEGERWRVASLGRIREVVFGAQDAIVSTVALVTAVAIADVGNTTVLIAGLASALAGMVSMSTGAYLGTRAEQDLQRSEIAKEAKELEEHPAEELAELVVLYQREGLTFEEARGVAEHVSADKDLWLRTLVEKELGISAEITSNPIKDAMTMGAAFVAAAFIPVLPYFFDEGNVAIGASIGASLLGLFALGVGKGRIVRQHPLLQGLEVLLIGAAAAGLGFVLGEVIPRMVT